MIPLLLFFLVVTCLPGTHVAQERNASARSFLGRYALNEKNPRSMKVSGKVSEISGLAISPGGVNIILESEDTYDLKPEIWYHELKITMPSGLSVATVGAVHLRPALDMRVTP